MGPWLTEEGREKWDVLAVTPQDRLSRDDLHFMAFVKNVLDWGKTLVVLNDPSFDISTETGRLIAYAKATQAAAELRKIRQLVHRRRIATTDIGSYGQLTLQLHAVQPVRIYPGLLIGQVTLWVPHGEAREFAKS
jgi:DNA invertase Pin-like site-specific DNA recombinase